MPSKNFNKLTLVKPSDIEDYYTNKISYKELAMRYNVSEDTMRKYFKAHKILTRTKYLHSLTNHNFFNIYTSDMAYILGLYVADGYITSNRFTIELNSTDEEILYLIGSKISKSYSIYHKKARINKAGIQTREMTCLGIWSKSICNTLHCMNCGKNKTYLEKYFFKNIPNKFKWDFIRGYFDGDGSIVNSKGIRSNGYTYNNYCFSIISKTPQLLKDIKDFLYREGIKSNIRSDGRSNYRLQVTSKKDIKIIFNKLYPSSLYLKRKYIKYLSIMEIPC